VYGGLFKHLIDEWIDNHRASTFDEFLDIFIQNEKDRISPHDWRYFVINVKPVGLRDFWKDTVRANTRHVYSSNEDGHTYYFRSTTMQTTIRYEVVTSYLHMKLNAKIQHVNGVGGAAAEFEYNGEKIRVQPVARGLYNILRNDTVVQENICAACLINKFKEAYCNLEGVNDL
jgi:hypothetical protein